jgi:hypothetical protein
VVYPGERDERVPRVAEPVTMGTIYVLRAGVVVDHYEVAAGPRSPFLDDGGHTGEPTPAGHYVLGQAERHTTANWPMSVVPWGAPLRQTAEGVIEYQLGSHWVEATGLRGRVTQAYLQYTARSGRPVSPGVASARVRGIFFFDPKEQKRLRPTWDLNDFGKWSWNLLRNGRRSAYYVHTTPPDEAADARHASRHLEQSHGCVHIQPRDRDEMVAKGYLRAGIPVVMMSYGLVGPPRTPVGGRR